MSEQNVASSSQQFELPSLEDLEQRATQVIKQTLKQNNYAIPQSYRFKLWMKLLNAKPISDPFNAQSKKSKLDEKNLSQLQSDSAACVKQIESLQRKTNQQTLAATSDILQAYCENNSLEYKQQLGQILAPIAFVASVEQDAATKEDEYYLLNKFIREYAPFLYSNTAEHLTCFCQLFRLLLQYHDPLLSLHMDKNRLMPEDYVAPYITSVFANQVDATLLCDLYDYFLIEGSPILVHFFAIAMYMHIRDTILAAKDEAVAELVKNRKITSKEEIAAVFKLAQELYQQTPSSARNQVDVLTYPTKETQIAEYLEWFKNNVVLPIPVSELVAAFRKVKSKTENPQKYFIIDCRSLKSFTYARLPTSVHVGNVGYDPKKLQAILDRFAGAKGTNFVVFGTGKGLQDEENLLRVIALKFVQYGFPHISIALGGFKECIKYIVNGEIEFVRDEKKKPVKAAAENNFLSTDFITNKVKDLWSWGKKVAEQYTTKEEKAAEAAKASASASATSTTVEGKTTEAPKSRNSTDQITLEEDSAFTLGDEEVELDFSEDEEEGPEDEKLVRISDLQALGNVNIFAAQLKTGKKQSEQRYIVVGDTFLMSMKSHPTMLHYGVIMWKRNLRQLLRLCYHKENNKIMTFVIKGTPQEIMAVTDETTNSFQETYFMEDSLKCVETIKDNTLKMKKRASQ